MSAPQRIARVTIKGRVQGVGYRFWTQIEAQSRGIAGWVRNRRDGDVEAVFAGPADAVEAMCAACWRGPSEAQVTQIDVVETTMADLGPGGAAQFEQRPTL